MPNDSSPRLLVVDDIEDNRDLLSRRFGRHGYEVLEADCGENALEMIADQPFDIVLLDIMMPGIDGLEVLRRLRETYSQDQLPVIMVSAKSLSSDVVEALLMGANDYITKPVDIQVALARVQAQLGRKRAGDAARAAQAELALSLESLRGALDADGHAAGSEFAKALSRLPDHSQSDDMVQLVDHAIDVLRQMTAEAGDPAPRAGSGSIRILSIEAQAAERDLVRQTLLQSAGDVEVTELADVSSAGALMGTQTFDLIVMGWHGSRDSAAIVRALRQGAAGAGAVRTPIVVLSDTDAVGPEALAAGADLHLVRPLTAAGLLNAALMRLSRKAA